MNHAIRYGDGLGGPQGPREPAFDSQRSVDRRRGRAAPLRTRHVDPFGAPHLRGSGDPQTSRNPRSTDPPLTSIPAMMAGLTRSRDREHAMADEGPDIGPRCVAAPVIDSRGESASAISMSGPAPRIGQPRFLALDVDVHDAPVLSPESWDRAGTTTGQTEISEKITPTRGREPRHQQAAPPARPAQRGRDYQVCIEASFHTR